METTGKCVRALNSTTLKLPGDAKTIRRAVDALTARFTFRFPMRAVHARVVIDRTEGGVVRYVTPQFTFSEAMKESERMEEYREQTAEAKQVADELEGVVMRLDPKHAGRGGSPKEPKGRPVATDFKADQRIADAWKSPQHTTHADVARALNIPVTEVKKALDRHRQREAKAKRDKSRNSEAE